MYGNITTADGEVPVTEVTIFLVFLIIISVFSNSLVCCAFIIQPRLRRVLYYPVLNLAIADILCGLVAMTSYLAKKHVFGGRKQQVICDISRFSYFTTEYASIFSLTIISVDRALAILRPLKYQTTMTSKRMKVILAVIWCYTIMISSIPYFIQRPMSNEHCSFRPTKQWSIYVIIINVLAPFMIITVCQIATYTVALRHLTTIKRQNTSLSHSSMVPTQPSSTWLMEKKATTTLSVVIGLFLLFWGPSTIYYSMSAMDPATFNKHFKAKQGLYNALVKLLTFANSCFNPFIYAWLNHDFRKAFIQVLNRRFYKNKTSRLNEQKAMLNITRATVSRM